MEKKNPEDLLEDFFNEIEEETLNKTSNAGFKEKIEMNINNATNSDTFKKVTNLINDGITSLRKTLTVEEPAFNYEVSTINTRLDFVKAELNKVSFDLFNRGKYKIGYLEALSFYISRMEISKYNLLSMEKDIKKALKKKLWKKLEKGDRYNEGYQAGLKFLSGILYNSKIYMMEKIKEEL